MPIKRDGHDRGRELPPVAPGGDDMALARQQGDALRVKNVVAGGKVTPVLVVDSTLNMLWRRGSITRDHYDAGRRFEAEFRVACLDGTKLQQWEYRSPSADRHSGDALMDARDYVAWAMRRLGGYHTMLASVVWQVLGMQQTLKGCAISIECERARRGMLIAALDLLAAAEAARRKEDQRRLRPAAAEIERRVAAARRVTA